FEEMCKAKVIKRLCKRLPQSPELEGAIAAHDELDGFEVGRTRPVASRPALSLSAGDPPEDAELPRATEPTSPTPEKQGDDGYQDDRDLAE
ncbi:MAG TPA: hypothetical protein VF102_04435, partial [Gemmatimonadaceae bacterium]